MNAPPTTAALLTAPARGGIAVIALAGLGTRDVLARVFRPRAGPATPCPGALTLGRIVSHGRTLDEAIVTLSEAGAETLAEVNIHGGPLVARKVLTLLAECGARVLGPEAGRVDPALLAAAGGDNPAIAREMLEALPSAATPLAASAVTSQWSAGLSALARSALEATPAPRAAALRAAAAALPVMKRLLQPAEVVIAGPPNVGKSALTNALVGRNVSIVSAAPGTTRDWVRCPADADGVAVWLTDTAGLWEEVHPDRTADAAARAVDAEAVRRAWERIAAADLVVCVTAGPAGEYAGLVARLRARGSVLNVAGKSDLIPPDGRADVAVSAVTLAGTGDLRRAIRARLGLGALDPAAAMAFTDRQARLASAAADALLRLDNPAARAALDELLRGRTV